MIDLVGAVDWLKTVNPEFNGCISAGCLDATRDKWVGVYEISPKRRDICIGGEVATKVHEQRISILLHWSKYPEESRTKAWNLYEALCALQQFEIGALVVQYIDPGAGPVNVGRDEKGVYEYVINATIYYERMESI